MYVVLFDGLKQKLMCRKWSRELGGNEFVR